MNPSLPQSVIDRALEADPEAAAAEYGAEFRGDIGVFVSRDAVEAAITSGVIVRAPVRDAHYVAFVDPSGGSSDAMTMAIAHRDGASIVLDLIAERKPPFSPESVVAEFAAQLKRYGVRIICGDRYAGEWPRERFAVHGIRYQPSERNRSEIYLSFLVALNSGVVDLLDHSRMVTQFVGLERRTSRAGRDTVDHAPGAHDDIANSVAGVLVMLDLPRPAAPVAQVGSFNLGGGDGGYHPLVSSFDDLSGRRSLRYSDMPAEWWAARGYFHPNDRERWEALGVIPKKENAQ